MPDRDDDACGNRPGQPCWTARRRFVPRPSGPTWAAGSSISYAAPHPSVSPSTSILLQRSRRTVIRVANESVAGLAAASPRVALVLVDDHLRVARLLRRAGPV